MADESVTGTGSPGGRTGDQPGSVFQRASSDWGTFKGTLGDLGKDKSLEPIKDFKGLTESFINAQKMIGNSIRLPGKELKPEDRQKAINEILGKLRTNGVLEGVPESWEKYEVKMPQEEGWKVNQPLYDSFRQAAHKVGVTPSQAQTLFDWYINFQAQADTQDQMAITEAQSNLKKEYGGLYKRKMESARRWAGKFIGPDAEEVLAEMPANLQIRLIKALADAGEDLLEDALISGEISGVTTGDSIKKEIDALVANKDHPLWDVSKPGHKEAVENWTKLQQQYIALTSKKK